MENLVLKNNQILKGPILMPAPRFDRPNRQESFYTVKCLACGRTRNLRMADLRKDQLCRHCAGIKSSTKTSNLEDVVIALLQQHQIKFEQHVPLYRIGTSVDFYLPEHDVFLECIGYWHTETKSGVDTKLKAAVNIKLVTSDGLPMLEKFLTALKGN